MTILLQAKTIHPSWHTCLQTALQTLSPDYQRLLVEQDDWLPGKESLFNAFTLPLDEVQYVLLGESPYPRSTSANGYAFWDNAVRELWSPQGMSKKVNRATSLRNIIKMLLVANRSLSPDNTQQTAIAALDKSRFISTNDELFQGFIKRGFLLLNASLVLRPGLVRQDAKIWRPFLSVVLHYIAKHRKAAKLLLLGNIAKEIPQSADTPAAALVAEHPYNLSFITNPEVLSFFKPLHLLEKVD